MYLKKRTKIILGIAMAGVAAIVLPHLISPIVRMHELRAACAGADRIVIDINPFPLKSRRAGSSLAVSHTWEIVGRDKVAEFADAISFRPSPFAFAECKCFGDTAITVYSGDQIRADLRIKHREAIAWRNGPWIGDAQLTGKSYDRIEAFLIKNGCPPESERVKEFFDLSTAAQKAEAESVATSAPADSNAESPTDHTAPVSTNE